MKPNNIEKFEQIPNDIEIHNQKELFEEDTKTEKELNQWVKNNGLEIVRSDMEKEKQLDLLRKQMLICRGTGIDGDCKRHFLADYNIEKNENIKIDERLIRFIVNEILKTDGISGVIITSGFRCQKHNEYSAEFDTSGKTKKKSLHMEGDAVDFILLGKNGRSLTFQGCKNFEKIIEDKSKYQFSQEKKENGKSDWDEIQEEQTKLDLTAKIKTIFYIASYQNNEGRDPDNDHLFAYFHFDFRNIESHGIAKEYYQKSKLPELYE